MILAIVGVIVVLLGFFFLFVRPRQQELADVRENIEAEEARTVQLKSELARLEELQEKAPQLEADLSRLRRFVPDDDEVPNFIFLVQESANQAGVDFVQITPELPKPPPEGAALAEIRVQIGAGGGYFAVQDFIRRLHALDRALRIDNMSLTGEETETGDTRLTADMTSRIFFDSPQAAATTDDADAGADTADDDEPEA